MKFNCGLEHGQPAQRAMSTVIFDGFPWVFHPSWPQSSQNGVPIVQLMFLYEARAHASYRNIISTIGTHFWPLSVKLERTGFSTPKRKQGNKDIIFSVHFCQSGVSAGLGLAWLSLDSWVGKRGSGQAGTCRQALNYCIKSQVTPRNATPARIWKLSAIKKKSKPSYDDR